LRSNSGGSAYVWRICADGHINTLRLNAFNADTTSALPQKADISCGDLHVRFWANSGQRSHALGFVVRAEDRARADGLLFTAAAETLAGPGPGRAAIGVVDVALDGGASRVKQKSHREGCGASGGQSGILEPLPR